MLSLIIIKRTKDLVKTGMCKINESPCQLQLEARCFICCCPPRGVEWLFLQHGLVYRYFSSLSKKKKKKQTQKIFLFYSSRKATQETFAYVWGGLWGLSVKILAAQALAFILRIWSRSCHCLCLFFCFCFCFFYKRNPPQHQTPLQTKLHQQIT